MRPQLLGRMSHIYQAAVSLRPGEAAHMLQWVTSTG
jgi:hypothetical protein